MPNDSYKLAWMIGGVVLLVFELIAVTGFILAPNGSKVERRWLYVTLASVVAIAAWLLMDILLDHPGYSVLLRR